MFNKSSARCSAISNCLFVFALCLSSGSCDQIVGGDLTGHRTFAAELRLLLDEAYAGIDYKAFHSRLSSLSAVADSNIARTPHEMRPYVEAIMGYLAVADTILEVANDKQSTIGASAPTWLTRYPFLNAAMGARAEAPGVFDVETAFQLLLEKTDLTLVAMQIKNKPI